MSTFEHIQSRAVSGQGTKFFRETSQIGEINNIAGPTKSRETIDVTRLEDDDGYRRFIASLRDPGTVTMNMNFVRENYDVLNGDYESDDLVEYSIQFPDPDETTFTFMAIVTELPVGINIGDKITSDVTLKISGPVHISAITSV